MATGTNVPREWQEKARERAQYFFGIANYNDDGIKVFDELAMMADEAALEQKIVYFPNGALEVDSTHQSAMADIYSIN